MRTTVVGATTVGLSRRPFAGATVIFRLYWRRFRALFSNRRAEDDALDTSKT
jgi:hypothetical protein